MIYVGENKSILCKGDFRPAQLYKGDKKIAGYELTEFEGLDSVTLENCYNDKLYDAYLHGKNLLDVKKVYPNYANDEGGITYGESDVWKVYAVNMYEGWKENTQYTFSANYEITNADNNRINLNVLYTDGTNKNFWNNLGGTVTGSKSGYGQMTTEAGKTVQKMIITFSTQGRALDVKLTNMQLEEGSAATEYEPPLTDATITVKSMENTEKSQTVLFENGGLTAEIPTFKGTTIVEIDSEANVVISGKYKKREVE